MTSVRVVTSKDLGTLTSADIEQDCSGFGPDWFLDKVFSQEYSLFVSPTFDQKVAFHLLIENGIWPL